MIWFEEIICLQGFHESDLEASELHSLQTKNFVFSIENWADSDAQSGKILVEMFDMHEPFLSDFLVFYFLTWNKIFVWRKGNLEYIIANLFL